MDYLVMTYDSSMLQEGYNIMEFNFILIIS